MDTHVMINSIIPKIKGVNQSPGDDIDLLFNGTACDRRTLLVCASLLIP